MEFSHFLSIRPSKSLASLGGSLVSMDFPRTEEKRNSGLNLTILVIWLMERGVLAGTSMRFSIQETGTGVLAPLFRWLIFVLGFLNSP